MPLVSSVDTAYAAYYKTFAWRSLTTGTIFPLVFNVDKLFPVFRYTLALTISQTKSVGVIERISVCALTRTYITCTSTDYVDVPELPHPRGRGRSHSYNAAVWRFVARSNRNNYLLVFIHHACACHIYPCTHVPTEIQ